MQFREGFIFANLRIQEVLQKLNSHENFKINNIERIRRIQSQNQDKAKNKQKKHIIGVTTKNLVTNKQTE